MRRFAPVLLTLILFSGPGFTPRAGAVEPRKNPCVKLLEGTGRLIASPFKRMGNSYKQFQIERRQQGAIRWLLAPRYEGMSFNRGSLFNPVELPVEILSLYTSRAWGFPVLRRPSRWVSFPVTNALWLLPFIWLADSAQTSNIEVLENNLRDDRFGAAYITDWVSQEKIGLAEGARMLTDVQKRFVYDLEPLRHRAQSFVRLGLWSPAQAALANRILDGLRDRHPVPELIHETKLKELIGADPLFAQLQESITSENEFTIELWVQPEVRLKDRADAEWLALLQSPQAQAKADLTVNQKAGLSSLVGNNEALDFNLPLTTLAAMTADSVADPDLIQAKVQEAVRLHVPTDQPFVYRADFPIFQSVQTLHELSGDKTFDSELELWSLIYGGDPRFAEILPLVEDGGASEFAALYEVSGRLRDLNSVYALYRKAGDDPAPRDFCPLIYGENGEQPNTYFVSLQGMDGAGWQAVFADINYDSLVESSRAVNKDELAAAIQRGDQRTQATLKRIEQGEAPPQNAVSCFK